MWPDSVSQCQGGSIVSLDTIIKVYGFNIGFFNK